MFNQMKQLYDMQKKAKELQRQLEAIKIEKATSNRSLVVSVNGAQKIESIQIDPTWLVPNKKSELEGSLVKLINESFEAAQKQSATQAAALMKDLKGLGLPGF
jgi:DNA-binding protein YbaB